MLHIYAVVAKENANQLEDSFGSIKKSKIFSKNIRLVLAILYCMVYYIDVGGKGNPSKEKNKNGKEED